jgi:protoporphyrin/coproporphyrin ferrochelatase
MTVTIAADHPPIVPPRIGVLLVNLGTPDAPTPGAVRRYLKQFLSDRRVVELPTIVWQPILRGIILNTRPKKSAHAYAQVWTEQGSPLAAITARQAAALAARLGDSALVRHAMRYGNPAIHTVLDEMIAAGCRRILIAPLYPQYCGATTATVTDAVHAHLATLRWQPALRTLPPYHDDAAYIGALKDTVEAQLAALDFAPDVLLASFHGMPERTLKLGDPYHCHCVKTARLLSEAMGRPIEISFQSRFGRAKWLEPATDATIERLAGGGVKRLAIIAPGFSADCLETLEELAMQGRDAFVAGGGTNFAYLPCLNDGEPGMAMLEALVRRELSGWLT